jgi:hypothetical protein
MQVLLRRLGLVLPLVAAVACNDLPSSADSTTDKTAPTLAGHGATDLPPSADSDGDGLCDATEERLRTNPAALDTDADGFPDAVEQIAGYNATDPTSPGPDQVGYLVARPGRTLDFEVRATVQGSGEAATGQFQARSAFDPHGLSARDFFVSALAVDAVPPDNVRGIEATSERFGSVLGRTRLTFRLHFAFHSALTPDCAPALPFTYAAKGDNGSNLARGDYLLVASPNEGPVRAQDYCRPVACL